MTPEQINSRVELFRSREWTRADVANWYGIDWEDEETQRILIQARLFAGTHEHQTELGDGPYDRIHLEMFFQRRELVPLAAAAAEWAMSTTDFCEVVAAFNRSEFVSFVGPCGPSKSIIRRSFLRDFHKGFESLRRSIFANHSAYIQRIHHVIRTQLDVPVTTIWDGTDRRLRDVSPRPGYRLDCLTEPVELIGLGREVPLDIGKPIELAPDYCSCITLYDHQALLEPLALRVRSTVQETLDRLSAMR